MHILLTQNDTIDPHAVAMAHLIQWEGEPRAEFLLRRKDVVEPLSFAGDEAIEAWTAWQRYVRSLEGPGMKSQVYDQLARSGLLPADQSAAILAGNMAPLKDIVMNLLICSMDCHAMTDCDVKSTWTYAPREPLFLTVGKGCIVAS